MNSEASTTAARKAAILKSNYRPKLAESDDEAAQLRPLTITVREAARLSGLSIRTIRRHMKAGTLHFVQVGRLYLISFPSFERMVLGREEPKSAHRVYRPLRENGPQQ
jgi:excisionase family DNA binding protein